MHHELQGSSKARLIGWLDRLNRRSLTSSCPSGVELTSGEAMNVQGKVQLLLIEVIDAEGLCMLYHGWAPWSWL